MKKIVGILSSLLASLTLFVLPVFADSLSVNFENPPYLIGNINGQDGWIFTGPYDTGVVANTFGFSTFGTQSFRISDALTSGSFGDWVFTKSLTNESGETVSENGAYSGGVRQNHFEAQFDIATTKTVEQPGLHISISPDRGDGARMSYLRFVDQSEGVHVYFDDYQDGAVEPAGTCSTGDNFIETDIATISRNPHTIKFAIDFIDGPNNDIVKIYIDGILKHTGTSWEGYFNYCEGNPTRTVDSLIIQSRTGGGPLSNPANLGEGFLIDNLSLMSGPIPVNRTAEITSPDPSDNVSGNVTFEAFLTDDDADAIQWAVRQGTCAANTGTVFGNVDGHTDTATINTSDLSNQTFSFTADMSSLAEGMYCFVYNPVEDSGETNIRETVQFNLVHPLTTPTEKNQCKKDGWMSFNNPTFKNQGDCVSYVQSNEHATGNKEK